MNILILHCRLRKDGINYIRCRYLLADLQTRGHTVQLASYIAETLPPDIEPGLEHDIIAAEEVRQWQPDVLLIELGAFSIGDRVIGRDYLNELKANGCIIVHCGLDYNEYNRNREKYDHLFRTAGFEIATKEKDSGFDELPNIRGPHGSQTARTPVMDLRDYCSLRGPRVFEGVEWVECHHALVLRGWHKILLVAGPDSYIKAYNDDIHGDSHAIYGAFNDQDGIEIVITGHFVTDRDSPDDDRFNRRFLVNVLEYLYDQHPVRFMRRIRGAARPTRIIISYAWQDNGAEEGEVGLVDAFVQALRDRHILVDRDVEIFRAGHMPLSEWCRRLPEVDKVVFFHSEAWRNRPTPRNELLAAEREADRRFVERTEKSGEPEPLLLFFCLDETPVPERHHSHLYRKLRGRTFEEAVEQMYRDIVGLEGEARSYDISKFSGKRL